MSQADLGRALAPLLGRPWSRQAMSAAEKGARDFKVAELVAIARVLGTTVSQLVLPGPEVMSSREGRRAIVFPSGQTITAMELMDAVLAPEIDLDSERGQLLRTGNELADYVVEARAAIADADQAGAKSIDALGRLLHQVQNLARLAPEAGQAQPVVAVIVTSARGVLVGRRNDGKPPWTFIAGEIEPGEQPEDAAVREVKEETGLEVRAGRVIGERDHPATGRHMIYLAAKPAGRSTRIAVGDEAELAEVRWVSLAEADELLAGMFDPVRGHLARELETTNPLDQEGD